MAISGLNLRPLFLAIFLFASAALLLHVRAVDPMAYSPQTWVNDISLSSNSYPGGTFRSILLRQNPATFGPSIACGFICSDPCDEYLFALFFVQTNSDGSIKDSTSPKTIWSVNKHPVTENAVVKFHDGDLVLYDGQGVSVWSTGTSGDAVAGINITETGNLVLFGQGSATSTSWQSKNQPPGNVLFPGQILEKGHNLTQGYFYVTVEYDGLYFFVDPNPLDSTPPETYCFLRNPNDSPKNTMVSVNYTNTRLTFQTPSKEVPLTNLVPAKSSFQFMALDDDGRIRIYDWIDQQWKATGDLFDGNGFSRLNCSDPMTCGTYGVYSNKSCTCPGADRGNASYFKPINARQPKLGCSPVTALACDAMHDHQFLTLAEVSYFSYFDIQSAAFSKIDEESCVQSCLSNCSCKAALFMHYPNSSDGYCFLPSEILSLTANNVSESIYHSTAHIKVQNATESSAKQPAPVRKSSNVGVILGSTAGALAFVLFVGCIVLVYIRRRRVLARAFRIEETVLEDEDEHIDQIPGMLTRFSFEQLALATDNFVEKLGKGGFGSVYMGKLGRENIAVKILDGISQGRKEFLAEVQTIGTIHHFNLVRLIGFCDEKSHRILVYEFMPNGSLDKWIFDKDQHTSLSWQMRRKIVLDIAKGLSYLHEECAQRIAHLDIKPQNILLDDKFNAKVSDFGLAKLIERDQTHVMTMMRGTPGYLAPEWLTSFITEKVDVYSFGVMVLEIVSGIRNLDASQSSGSTNLISLLQDRIRRGRLLDLLCNCEIVMAVDQDEAIQTIKLATWCMSHDPDRRPSMSTVVKVLEGVVNVETGVEANFIASMPAMRSELYGSGTSSSDYAASASPLQSASLLSGAR